MATVLCVDDEPALATRLGALLERLGHRALITSSAEEALAAIGSRSVDLVISDYRMSGLTGHDLLGVLRREGNRIPVIITTGYSSIEHAVESIKLGATDYLTKPIQAEALEIAVNKALEIARLRRENEHFRTEISRLKAGRSIVGASPQMRAVLDTIATVAPTRATVLLQGESGTGKELFARAIHDQSPRHDGPFISVNCAAMPDGLVESALFGHEKGAFTGATGRMPGAFERADGGTLLLDEISEMRLDLQAKLLRVIQEQEFERVGGHEPIKVDVRLVATTNRDLKAEAAAGRFREDLFYRLNVVPIRLPPLRERQGDIPLLVHHFLHRAAEQHGVPIPPLAPETMPALKRARWPGNVRELANAVERAVILARGEPLTPGAFTEYLGAGAEPAESSARPSDQAPVFDLEVIERDTIARALEATGGNRTRAAKLLGLSERTLRNRLNRPKSSPPQSEEE